MAIPIYLAFRSSTPGDTPAPETMPEGRLAINMADERLFFKNTSGAVVEPKPRNHTHVRADITDFYGAVAIPSGADLDTYNTAGLYFQNNSSSAAAGANYPNPVAGFLVVHSGTTSGDGGNSFAYQEYTTYHANNSAKKYYRNKYNQVWGPWKQLNTQADVACLPLTGGTVTGAITLNTLTGAIGQNASYTTPLSQMAQVLLPGGGFFSSANASVTGAIQILLPARMQTRNNMMRLKVAIYGYKPDEPPVELWIHGYFRSSGGWTAQRQNVTTIASDFTASYPVSFGTTAEGRPGIWIGSANFVWNYPAVAVTEAWVKYNSDGATVDDYASGWEVSITDNIPDIVIQYSKDNTLTAANATRTVYREVLPTGAHTLDSYTSNGYFYQRSLSGASAGTNYPVSQPGWLNVESFDTNATYQTYHTWPSSGGSEHWFRIRNGSTWTTWEQVLTSKVVGVAGGIASLDSNARLPYTQAPTLPVSEISTNATLNTGLLVRNTYIRSTSTSNIEVTVPNDPTIIPGDIFYLYQANTGTVTVSGDTGVTINFPSGGSASTSSKGMLLQLKCVATNIFDLVPYGTTSSGGGGQQGGTLPIGFISVAASRSAISGGFLPLDGQELSQATYPDFYQLLVAGTLPTTDEATWQADPTQRGKFVVESSTGNFRMADHNGQSGSSLGAVTVRGDGSLSAGEAGVIQRDALQNLTGTLFSAAWRYGLGQSADGVFTITNSGTQGSQGSTGQGSLVTFDASRVARTSTETRALNVTSVWTIKVFDEISNSGSVDVTALAADVASLETVAQSIDFTIIYPNGGSAASPANVAVNSRYVETNPFPGYKVLCLAEVLYQGQWGNPGWYYAATSRGVVANQLNDDSVIVQTGQQFLLGVSAEAGGVHGNTTTVGGSLPCRVKVWKVRSAT